jgi:glycosyltransferase involved in cell wall biosynthesis
MIGDEADRAEMTINRVLAGPPDYRVTGPLVSVITIAYNEEELLPLQLTALANQTYGNIGHIVVDNMSQDRTVQIAQQAGAKVVINRDYNLCKSRNMGAMASSGDILIFMDADTFPEQTGVETVVREIQKGNVMVHMNHCSYDSDLHSILQIIAGHTLGRFSFSGLFIGITRQAFLNVGGFDETVLPQEGKSEDIEFIYRVMDAYPGLTSLVKNVFVATSARRYKAHGYASMALQHWQTRAVR